MFEENIKKLPKYKIFSGKKVLVRVDFNIPVLNGKIEPFDDFKIKRTLPLLKDLEKRNAKIILISHFGRPEGKIKKELSLKNISKYFSKIVKRKFEEIKNREKIIKLLEIDEKTYNSLKKILFKIYYLPKKPSKKLEFNNKDIIILENLRFDKREEQNKKNFSKLLATLCDIYINEAFSASHREHSSIIGVKNYVKEYYYGPLFYDEVRHLSKIFLRPKRPLVLVLGGAKVKTKLFLMIKFLDYADHILLGGVLANTLLAAKGYSIGESLYEKEVFDEAKEVVKKIDLTSTKLHLPLDVICTDNLKNPSKASIKLAPVGNLPKGCIIGDLGKDTIDLFSEIIKNARTIIWNGPLGYTETKEFEKASVLLLKAIAQNKKAFTIAGGGDTVAFLKKHKGIKKIKFVSTGGGAMLEFLLHYAT